jgi:hypothetical protein
MGSLDFEIINRLGNFLLLRYPRCQYHSFYMDENTAILLFVLLVTQIGRLHLNCDDTR